MSSKRENEEYRSHQPTPPRWKGSDSLELVQQINERILLLLRKSTDPYRTPWIGLEERAIKRAAQIPFLIADVRFTDEAWWQQVVSSPKTETWDDSPAQWTSSITKKLMNEVLLFAFHTVRWDMQVARMTVGMTPAVANIIRRLTQQQLEGISDLNSGAFTLRWQQDIEFWKRLIRAAREEDEVALEDIHLHAKLLLTGKLMAGGNSQKMGEHNAELHVL